MKKLLAFIVATVILALNLASCEPTASNATAGTASIKVAKYVNGIFEEVFESCDVGSRYLVKIDFQSQKGNSTLSIEFPHDEEIEVSQDSGLIMNKTVKEDCIVYSCVPSTGMQGTVTFSFCAFSNHPFDITILFDNDRVTYRYISFD